MVVVCENCRARFKFDERRLKPSGIKVHCSKCRHTFHLKPPTPLAEPSGQDDVPSPEWLGASPRVDPSAPPDEPAPQAPEAPSFSEASPPVEPGMDTEESWQETDLAAGERPEDIGDEGFADWTDESAPFPDPQEEEETEGAEAPGPLEPEALDPEDRADLSEASAEGDDRETEEGDSADTADPAGDDNPDFDWDHISFNDGSAKTEPGTVPRASSDLFGGPDEEETLELVEDRRRPRSPGLSVGPAPGASPKRDGGSQAETLQLDRSSTVERRKRPPVAPSIPQEAPGARPVLARPSLQTTPTYLPTVTQDVQPVGSRLRLQRRSLELPRTVSLVVSCVLGIAVAAISATTLYSPGPRIDEKARAVGTVRPRADLSITGAAGERVERLNGGGLLVVTGKAQWEGTTNAPYYLEGVLVDPKGRILQRRTARLGPTPGWEVIAEADPLRFAVRDPLPAQGETPFTILFTPDPQWRVKVRFEIRPGG
jgi:predicted Zn finger-like uncharacterized protein